MEGWVFQRARRGGEEGSRGGEKGVEEEIKKELEVGRKG